MQILSINAESQLAGIVSSIGRTPSSWKGWSCLHIEMSADEPGQAEGAMLWVQSILESYLKGVEGRVFFCHERHIHIFCKDTAHRILDQVAKEIGDLLLEEDSILSEYNIYDLVEDGVIYAGRVLERTEDFLPVPVSRETGRYCFPADDLVLDFDRGEQDKTILNYPDYARVLLIEDDPVTRWIVRKSLRHACRFATAPTASQAYAMFQSFQPDIVFLDINLPDQSGRAVLEWILRNDPGVRVIMFSSNDNLDNIAQTLEKGASGFIAKPFLKEELLHYVRGEA